MKEMSVFSKIILLIVVSVLCIVITVCMALLFGNIDVNIIDFGNMNFSNMIPVFIIGIFLSCVIVGIALLLFGKSIFSKVINYINETDKGEKH